MEHYDAMVIGAGLLGCFAARELVRYDLRVGVLEAREDVCTGISKANSAIVYTGCDTKPGTLKTKLCVHANHGFESLCEELSVPFRRCGSLMVCFGENGEAVLKRKRTQGMENGVEGLVVYDRERTLAEEPRLNPKVRSALYASDTGTVNPWELCFGAYENARQNGAEFHFQNRVLRILRQGKGYRIAATGGDYLADSIVNCAGLRADEIAEMLEKPSIRIIPTKAEYLVLEEKAEGWVRHVIFHEPETKSKGLTLVPTTDGTILVGATEREAAGKEDGASTKEGIAELQELTKLVTPSLPLDWMIRNFSALRPNAYKMETGPEGSLRPSDIRLNGFSILEEEGLLSMIGIKTPGLTCASDLGKLAAKRTAEYLGRTRLNPRFDGRRTAIPCPGKLAFPARAALVAQAPAFGKVLCRCRNVTEGEILEAIRRGAVTIGGVQRRTGAALGRCQGGECMDGILRLLSSALHKPVWKIQKEAEDSWLVAKGEPHGML